MIILLNGILNGMPINLIITIPQFLLIFIYVLEKNIDKAVIWHFIFMITSYSIYNIDVDSGTDNITAYNYAKYKIFGPLSYSYLITLILFIYIHLKKNNSISIIEYIKHNNALFYNYYNIVKYFMFYGLVIGLINVVFSDYYIDGIISYGGYIVIVFLHSYILLNIDGTLVKKYINYIFVDLLLVNVIIDSFINLFFEQSYNTTPLSAYTLLLIPSLLFKGNTIKKISAIALAFYNMINYGTGGKSLILLIIMLFVTLYLTFQKDVNIYNSIKIKFIRFTIILALLFLPAISLYIGDIYGGESFTVSKMYQVKTLINYIINDNNIYTIAESPYIRISSLQNILYEGIENPYALIFGKGYGGYFTDHYGYFTDIDLSKGAFSDIAIKNRQYYTGHDSLVTIPMFNGMFGLVLIIIYVLKCIKSSKYNYLLISSIPFLLLIFYYNTLIGITGVLLLYSGTLNISNTKCKRKY